MTTPPRTLDVPTVRELARQLEERIRAVEIYGAGGYFASHEAEARAFLSRLKAIIQDPRSKPPPRS